MFAKGVRTDAGGRAGLDRLCMLVSAILLLLLTSGAQLPSEGPAPTESLYLVPNDLAAQLAPESIPIHQYATHLLVSLPRVAGLPPATQSLLTPVQDVDTVAYRTWSGAISPTTAGDVEALAEGYYLVAFTGPVDAQWRSALESFGLRVVDTATPYGVLVKGDGPALSRAHEMATSFGFDAVRGVVPLPLEARAGKDLLRLARGELTANEMRGLRRRRDGRVTIRIEIFPNEDALEVASRVRNLATPVGDDPNVFAVRGPEILEILRDRPEVAYIEAVHARTLHDNLAVKSYILNVEPVWTEPSLGYDGTGVIVGHNDSGVDLTHPDFPAGTIVTTAGAMSGTDNGHGTHTAGSVLGRGLAAGSPTNTSGCGDGTAPLASIRGSAWGARLVTNNLFDGGFTTETSMMEWAYQQGALIDTNSWGYVSLFSYSSHAATVDGLVRDADSASPGNQELSIFFSAGNDGPGSGTIGSPGTAKNTVTVGASQNDRCGAYIPASCSGPDIDAIACFSSRGPAQGRIKPDLVATGTEILSVESSDPLATNPWDQSWTGPEYATNNGTSMSTPLAAGTAAVFFQFYQDQTGAYPSPALAKAALVNGAVDMGFGYPSFDQGWGRLNLRSAIEGPPGGAIRFFDQPDTKELSTGTGWSTDFEVFSSGVPVKITLVWTDPPGPSGSSSPLVNDLNLLVIDSGGTVYRGNQFTGSWSTPNPGAVTDTANNVENVFVRTPSTGAWTIQVSSALTATNPPNLTGQDFALVYSGDAADCLPPTAPTGLAANAPAANRIDLSWNPEASAASYNVYRATSSGGPFTEIANVLGTAYTDLAVSGGTTYYYTVTSVNATGCESAPSNEAFALATGDCTLPPLFGGLTSVTSSGSTCAIDLSWDPASSSCPSSGVVYNVYRSTMSGFTPGPTNLLDACVTGTSFQDTNVTSGTTYYYVVEAEDGTLSGSGPCNGGNVDGNLVEMSGAPALTTTTLYSNDFETADDFTHAPNVAGKGDSWRGIRTNCPAASGSGIYRFGGLSCSANYSDDNFASAGPAAVSVPAGTFNVTLSFDHRWEFERDAANVYDGGYIAASVDGSAFQPIAPGRLSGTGYDDIVDGPCSNGIGTNVFTGTSGGYASGTYQSTMVDLDGVCDDITGGTGGCAGHDVQFQFTGVTDCTARRDGWFLDNVVVAGEVAGSCTAAPDPVPFFTVTSSNGQNELEWMNPASGGDLTIVYRTDRFPNDPADGTVLTPPAGTPGAHQSFLHQPLTNGTTYYYGAYVGNGAGDFSSGRFTSGRPQGGKTLWVYNTSASAIVPPSPGAGLVHAVSNDRILHAVIASNGTWPSGYTPVALDAPESRLPVVPTPVGGASRVLFAGSLDGDVHAVDALTGTELWTSPTLGERIQAAPSGMFTVFKGAWNLLFVGTRNTTADNKVVALRVGDGLKAWEFDNGGGANAMGIVSGSASVDYVRKFLYVASRSPAGGSPNTLWCIEFTDTTAGLKWARALGDIDGSPVLHKGKIYVGTNASKIYAIDPDTGGDLWTAPFDAADGPVKGFIWPRPGTNDLFFATTNTVFALADGGSSASESWRVTSIPSPSTPLFLFGTPYLFVGSGDGKLYQLDVSTNPPTTTSEVLGDGTSAAGPPSFGISQGSVYVGSTLGAIFSIAIPLQ